MFEDLLDLFDRDRKNKGTGKRQGGLRGLLQRLGDHDDDRHDRHRGYEDDRTSRRDRDDDDDDRYERRRDDGTQRRRRDDMDWDD